MAESNPSRRRFLIRAAVAATALPLLARSVGSAQAATLSKLPLDNAQAQGLGYVEDATKTKAATHKPGSMCSDCQFFTATTGACAIFKGFAVSPNGWCSAWSKKAG
jgi:hypothetical protein